MCLGQCGKMVTWISFLFCHRGRENQQDFEQGMPSKWNNKHRSLIWLQQKVINENHNSTCNSPISLWTKWKSAATKGSAESWGCGRPSRAIFIENFSFHVKLSIIILTIVSKKNLVKYWNALAKIERPVITWMTTGGFLVAKHPGPWILITLNISWFWLHMEIFAIFLHLKLECEWRKIKRRRVHRWN